MTEEGRRLLAAATERPWRAQDNAAVWQLFGSPTIRGLHGPQIIKAPKSGTRYAEYWPTEADAALIVAAVNQYAALLDLWEAAATAVETYDREGVIDAAHELYVVIEDLRAALSQEEP